jgi:hypothetical protein
MNRRRLLLLLRIACGVLLLWWAWRQVDVPMREVLSTIQLDWAWLLPGIVLGGIAVAGWAMRWHLFLRMCGLEQPLGETLRVTLFADFFNSSDNLVTENQRQFRTPQFAIDHVKVSPANRAGANPHQELSPARLRLWHIAQLQWLFRFVENHGAHGFLFLLLFGELMGYQHERE